MRSDSRSRVRESSIDMRMSLQLTGFLLFNIIFSILIFQNTARAETTFKAAGEISALISEEFQIGFEQVHYRLMVGEREVHTLFFNAAPPIELKTGDFAYVEGTLVDDPNFGSGILVSNIYTRPQAQSLVSAASTARNALVIVVNFADTSANCSDNDAADLMWTGSGNINGLYQESSFNTLSFPQDTDGDNNPDVVNVTLSSNMGSSCDYMNWAFDADDAATAAGFDLGNYDHRIYILPQSVSCNWAGLGNLGCGSYCRAWTIYCSLPDVLAHELGHNLSLDHASTDTNNDGTTDCEYCDTSGIMGYGGLGYRHFNAPHKALMGWIPAERIETAASNGIYSIALNEQLPSEANPVPATSNQIVRTLVPGESSTYYYFSYRVQEGNYSAALSTTYRNKINIHRVINGSAYTYYVGAIGDGESFDDGNGVSISGVSASDTSVSFTLSVPESSTDGDEEESEDDEEVSDDSCSISGTVLQDGSVPNSRKRLRVIYKSLTGERVKRRSRLASDGSYEISNCTPGDSKIKVKRRKSRRRRARTIYRWQSFEAQNSNSLNISL